ncbi:NUDIX hydrolase [Falsihalocynthiibacter sp. SS001]|uniref:NUDIX hydrolase n=1 Tax=Falsihalocynthiibacter sp. SS001 TaxID=3349698 RepID=UPI0036D230E8
MGKIKQKNLKLSLKRKYDVRSQFGTICYRIVNGKVQILLVTSRRSRNWIVPKGWPMDGKTPAQAAEIEAWEEAGVRGKIRENCVGLYSYSKDKGKIGSFLCVVSLFALHVQHVEQKFPEHKERKRKWVSRKKAAKMVSEPALGALLRDFSPE